MAQEYVNLSENAGIGTIALSKSVFELITEITVDELKGVEKSSVGKFSSAIHCKIEKNKLNINVNVKVKYGANVNRECETLQHRIQQNILEMTNLECNRINITVGGFEIE
ncbi:MAG: Asp23/Gls24 family envelope stress response protein [Anaerorhabdus sp.]